MRQYLSTNSAKSTFLRNSGLVVKVTSSKSPTEQNLPARQSDISVLQTQVQSLMDIVLETRIVVDKCRQDMNSEIGPIYDADLSQAKIRTGRKCADLIHGPLTSQKFSRARLSSFLYGPLMGPI